MGTWNSKHIYISQLELKVIEYLCARRCVGHFCIILSFADYYKPCKLDGISTYGRGAVAERGSETAVEPESLHLGHRGQAVPSPCPHLQTLVSWFQCLPRLSLCTWPFPGTWISGMRPALLCPHTGPYIQSPMQICPVWMERLLCLLSLVPPSGPCVVLQPPPYSSSPPSTKLSRALPAFSICVPIMCKQPAGGRADKSVLNDPDGEG